MYVLKRHKNIQRQFFKTQITTIFHKDSLTSCLNKTILCLYYILRPRLGVAKSTTFEWGHKKSKHSESWTTTTTNQYVFCSNSRCGAFFLCSVAHKLASQRSQKIYSNKVGDILFCGAANYPHARTYGEAARNHPALMSQYI